MNEDDAKASRKELKGWDGCPFIGNVVLAVSALFAVAYLLVFLFQILT